MSAIPLMNREVALRVGLAARSIPGCTPQALALGLLERYGAPLTESRLGSITVEELHVVLGGEEGSRPSAEFSASLKAAARLLWGEGVVGSERPTVESDEPPLPGSILVAIASNQGENLDGHFGSCEYFLIYRVTPEALRLIAVRPALEADAEEDRNAARARLIADCQILYVQSIGGPAAAKVVRAGVHPIKVAQAGSARQQLARLQQALRHPPPWLARIMGVPAASLAPWRAAIEAEEAEDGA